MKYEILNRWTYALSFTAEIDCDEDAPHSVKRALAIKWALENSADLRGVDLKHADLRGVDLRGADLEDADLGGADLRYANLRGADLRGADLRDADLRDANLRDTNLGDAKGADLAIARTRILAEGDLIGWKKCKNNVIVKMLIPASAKRSHAFGRKCRAEFADVIDIFGAEMGVSLHDNNTIYIAGQRVIPDGFDEDWMNECSNGIHFFISRIEAEEYQ